MLAVPSNCCPAFWLKSASKTTAAHGPDNWREACSERPIKILKRTRIGSQRITGLCRAAPRPAEAEDRPSCRLRAHLPVQILCQGNVPQRQNHCESCDYEIRPRRMNGKLLCRYRNGFEPDSVAGFEMLSIVHLYIHLVCSRLSPARSLP